MNKRGQIGILDQIITFIFKNWQIILIILIIYIFLNQIGTQ